MGLFSKFEDKAEDIIEGGGGKGSKGGIEPVKIAKRAGKEMQREKMIGVGHEYAPTLYNVLVSDEDEAAMINYYPTLAGEVETYLTGLANQQNLVFDCPPLVRFIVDHDLRRGKFDVVAENVSPDVVEDLRHEEMVFYGLEEPEPNPYDEPYQNNGEFDPFAPSDQPYTFDEEQYNNENFAYAQENAQDKYQAEYEPADYASDGAGNAARAAYDSSQFPSTYEHNAGQQHHAQPHGGAGAVSGAAAASTHLPAEESTPAAAAAAAGAGIAAGAGAAAVGAAAGAAAHQAADHNHQSQQNPQQHPQQQQPHQDAAQTVLLGHGSAPLSTAYLIEHATNKEHALNGNKIKIGRSLQCDVTISDPGVSRLHAELIREADGWLIRDAKSTNGTRVNDVLVQQSQIFNGDVICLGNSELTFSEG